MHTVQVQVLHARLNDDPFLLKKMINFCCTSILTSHHIVVYSIRQLLPYLLVQSQYHHLHTYQLHRSLAACEDQSILWPICLKKVHNKHLTIETELTVTAKTNDWITFFPKMNWQTITVHCKQRHYFCDVLMFSDGII